MSLRVKLAVAFACLAALTAAVAGLLAYRSASQELYLGVDRSLLTAARGSAESLTEPDRVDSKAGDRPVEGRIDVRPPPPGTGELGNQLFVVQRIDRNGDIVLAGSPELPVNAADKALAQLRRGGFTNLRNLKLPGGERVRMASSSIQGGGVAQVARSVESISQTLDRLRAQVLLLTLIISLAAALLGAALASTISRRLIALTGAAERVADTGDLAAQVSVSGGDEIGRLARVFSRMLDSLRLSRVRQERLVQDAGHELRTPLTSITTNLALLDRHEDLEPSLREKIMHDLAYEAREMSQIINDLVALTSIGEDEQPVRLDLAELAAEVAEQASRRYDRPVEPSGGPAYLLGKPRALRHALSNLVDNAAKFDNSSGRLVIQVGPDRVEVKDRGQGIQPGDEQLIFERFHRSINSRSAPGSGLGLAIVSEVASQHQGKPLARNREGGGASIGFTFVSVR